MTATKGFVIDAFVTTGKSDIVKKIQHSVDALKAHEVFIKIKACGVCHTDQNYASTPGLVLGHEPVGEVKAVGSAVNHLVVGDLVGFAYMQSSCNECLLCHSGEDILCRKRTMFPEGMSNGYAYGAVRDSRYVYKIPKGMDPKYAGPLMCAGSTVFSAFYKNNISPTARVAIVGIGGLGHLGLQFARAWGCYVVAISTSKNKEQEARKFGAHEYWNSREFSPEFIEKAAKFDMILNTTSVDLDYDAYIDLLAPGGNLCMVGIPPNEIKFQKVLPFLLDEKKVTGRILGGRQINERMLDFAARHNIRPQIEEYPLNASGIAKAFDRLHHNTVRYRAVLIAPEEQDA
ncbi:hypothetical protein BX666DRAFT_1903689 [Dichotomocladium elegans]|nr:hypothetical protein BX666DRAFT_1903689 [Dichotomocladium elegans]